MGGGSSAKREVKVVESRYLAKLPQNGASTSSSAEDPLGPCDQCFEMRKRTQIGQGAKWLCAACQFQGDNSPPKLSAIRSSTSQGRPQLRRGFSTDCAGTGASAARGLLSDAGDAEDALNAKRRRGACKESQSEKPQEGKAKATAKAKLARSASLPAEALQNTLEERRNNRSTQAAKGLMQARGVAEVCASGPREEAADDNSPRAVQAPPPAPPKKKLAGGYRAGDRVCSLVSRHRVGLPVLELGDEGTVVTVTTVAGGGNTEEHLRALVQFHKFDWTLPLQQICATQSFASMKAAGLAGFAWGAKVRSLVTHLCPAGAERALRLGDEGVVCGPGHVRGKVAVRFEASGEWSVWPGSMCEATTYDSTVAQKLAGEFCRGDRVTLRSGLSGARSGHSAGSSEIEVGAGGCVVGPGHAAGRVLVHFDSDDRVWSLTASQLAKTSKSK